MSWSLCSPSWLRLESLRLTYYVLQTHCSSITTRISVSFFTDCDCISRLSTGGLVWKTLFPGTCSILQKCAPRVDSTFSVSIRTPWAQLPSDSTRFSRMVLFYHDSLTAVLSTRSSHLPRSSLLRPLRCPLPALDHAALLAARAISPRSSLTILDARDWLCNRTRSAASICV